MQKPAAIRDLHNHDSERVNLRDVDHGLQFFQIDFLALVQRGNGNAGDSALQLVLANR